MPEILIDKSTAEAIVQWATSRGIVHSGDMNMAGPDIVSVDLKPFDSLAMSRFKHLHESVDDAIMRLLEETNHAKAHGG